MQGWNRIWDVPMNERGQIEAGFEEGSGEANGPMRRTRLHLRV